MKRQVYIAVDLGAGSGRVFLVGLDPGELQLEEIHRFRYPPSVADGYLRWDFPHILSEIKLGLRKAGNRARELGRPVYSMGIDSWGVDYGLIDNAGNLLANPVCYRDRRTQGMMERVFSEVPATLIFEKTGIQFLSFNTIYQLYSEHEDAGKASTLLLMPDLINFFLTGQSAAEYTNATTTQMLNAVTREWDRDLIERLKLPGRILPKIIFAGTDLGNLKPELAEEIGLPGVRVTAPATHDTASAVAGAPLLQNQAYISSGTWSLIGTENAGVLINEDVEHLNFTNEGGAYETIRFLKNVMGLWIFECCRKEWKAAGIDTRYDTLLSEVADKSGFRAFIFPDDERFLNPSSMLGSIAEQLRETGQDVDESPGSIARVIFDSLAFRYASVLRSIERLTGRKLEGIQILGGGGRNRYLNQMTANASGLPATAGLIEATVVGNALVQAISAGRFSSLAQARHHISENFEFEDFLPQSSAELSEAALRYASIEDRFFA